ncbi:MAG: aminotransferase class I/II-fold pyridoxal phosphate-dependent enzyme [Thermodesulfobacteriota bacterium]
MTLETQSVSALAEALRILDAGFNELPEFKPQTDLSGITEVLHEVARRMQDNYPYPHPLYAGQMLKPPHPVARMAYMLSLWINPNNHALDGGRCSSAMEKEAVAEIAAMFGWDRHLGHLCGGGTMANLEALWVAGMLHHGKKVVASQQAHYTHQRICGVLRIPFEAIPCDHKARLDLDALKEALDKGDVGTVVVTIGTTATGSVDPLLSILELRERHGFRLHADAAYGGYFTLVDNLDPETAAVYAHLPEVDSLVIDPHKHGLQPYGCGCVLFKDPSVGRLYKHDSPYTYFTSSDLHLGEISLECSRPGSSAVALWATQRLLPPVPGGEFARDLSRCRQAALKLHELLDADPRFQPLLRPELDIVVWAPTTQSASRSSEITEAIFKETAAENLHLAKANMPRSLFSAAAWQDMHWDQQHVTCLRSCLMKPEHHDWVDRIYHVIDKVASRVLGC